MNGRHTNDDSSAPLIDSADTVRLKAVTKVENRAITSLLELIEDRNLVPQRITAQRLHVRGTGREVMQIEIDLAGLDLTADALRLMTAQIERMPTTLSTVVGDIVTVPASETARSSDVSSAKP